MTNNELNKKSNKLGVTLPITKTVEVGGKQVKIPQRFHLEEFKFGTHKLPQKYPCREPESKKYPHSAFAHPPCSAPPHIGLLPLYPRAQECANRNVKNAAGKSLRHLVFLLTSS